MKKLIVFIAIAFFFQHWLSNRPPEISEVKHDKVILYATEWCGYCKKTRAFLAEHRIEYTEYDIEKSEIGRSQHAALGGGGIPVLDIKGTIIRGYNTHKMQYAFTELGLMNATP